MILQHSVHWLKAERLSIFSLLSALVRWAPLSMKGSPFHWPTSQSPRLAVVLLTLSCPVLSCPVMSCPVLSCPVLSCPVLSCPVPSRLVHSPSVPSCPLTSCRVRGLFYPVLTFVVLCCGVLSCPVLSYPILSCPILSCPILSRPARLFGLANRSGRSGRAAPLGPTGRGGSAGQLQPPRTSPDLPTDRGRPTDRPSVRPADRARLGRSHVRGVNGGSVGWSDWETATARALFGVERGGGGDRLALG